MLPPFHGERMRAYEEVIAEVARARDRDLAARGALRAQSADAGDHARGDPRAVFGVADGPRRDELRDLLGRCWSDAAAPRLGVRDADQAARPVRSLRPVPAASLDRTDELLAAEIAERRADPDLAEREDILSMLVAARFDDGSAMDDREIRDQLMTLLLAGHETTATALAWAFDLLLHDPAALARAPRGRGRRRRRLPRRDQHESLRLRPVVPSVGRVLPAPAELGGSELPAGTR